jgi:hypothetical protein
MLWWPNLPMEGVEAETDAQEAAGFDLLWLCGTQHFIEHEAGREKLEFIFSEADRRGLEVMLQTWTTPFWYNDWNPQEEVERNRDFIARAWDLYGHHASFRTWYIGHEIYVVWGELSDGYREIYRGIVAACRETSPQCRVSISPFFILDRKKILGDFRFAEPEEYTEWWAETLRLTGLDLLMVQDSGEHASFTSIPEKGPFIAAYAEACREAGKEFWVNVETAEMDVTGYEALRDARELPAADQPWRPVPIPRLRKKLELAGRYSPHAVTWGWEYWRPARGAHARKYHGAFGEMNRPAAARS